MNVNFDFKSLAKWLPGGKKDLGRDPRIVMRVILGLLLLANIVAALVLLRPWAASPEELSRRLGALSSQVEQKKASVARLEVLVEKSRQARDEGDGFMDEYFLDGRTASSTIISELKEAADEAKVVQEDHTFATEPIEGSDDLSMMTISGNYEGEYDDLLSLINRIDRSPRFLILDTITASPERSGNALKMNFKMNAFVIDGKKPAAAKAPPAGEEADDAVEAAPETQAAGETASDETAASTEDAGGSQPAESVTSRLPVGGVRNVSVGNAVTLAAPPEPTGQTRGADVRPPVRTAAPSGVVRAPRSSSRRPTRTAAPITAAPVPPAPASSAGVPQPVQLAEPLTAAPIPPVPAGKSNPEALAK